ncbi:type VI secretion system-associated protein TagF [Neotabrizicola sp. sgz301269]|uniref:type VI secretion system-associated protein TagF n=1 Tax=Neotabrizicola sp. sgz301269 TaxID=3276282 RepID=UPI00376F7F22
MTEILTGFHGKLPGLGDFVSRGLPSGFEAFWDGWAAAHLARREGWPEAGLRLRLQSGGRVAAGVAIPGTDRVGRRFPLAGFVIAADLPGPAGLDPWCDAALACLRAAQAAGQGPDEVAEALEALPPPEGAAEGPPMALWAAGHPAIPCDAAAPEAALSALFANGPSCC